MDDTHLKETLVSRESLLQGGFLNAVRDTVRLPDGTAATREYIRHPGAVVIVPLLDDAGAQPQLVLERQYRHAVSQTVIELPAGKLDPQEGGLACGQRELREETGYTAREWAFAGRVLPTVAYSTEVIEIWFARGLSAGVRQLDAGEFLDVYTAPVDELLAACLDGRVIDSKTLACAFWLQNWRSGRWQPDWRAA